jgi:hypothetical protein
MAAWPAVWKEERRAISAKSDDEAEEIVLKYLDNKKIKVKLGPYRLLENVLNLDSPFQILLDFHCMKKVMKKDKVVRVILRKELSAVEDFEKEIIKVLASEECGKLDFSKEIEKFCEKEKSTTLACNREDSD